MDLNEKIQIKRKYGVYDSVKVNSSAPIRDSVISFVGNRHVTEEELKNHLNKLSENKGSVTSGIKWLSKNSKYFESVNNRGQKTLILSKYGKRILEFINSRKLNESDSIYENFDTSTMSNNTIMIDVVKSIKKHEFNLEYKDMIELLSLLIDDLKDGGYDNLNSYLNNR